MAISRLWTWADFVDAPGLTYAWVNGRAVGMDQWTDEMHNAYRAMGRPGWGGDSNTVRIGGVEYQVLGNDDLLGLPANQGALAAALKASGQIVIDPVYGRVVQLDFYAQLARQFNPPDRIGPALVALSVLGVAGAGLFGLDVSPTAVGFGAESHAALVTEAAAAQGFAAIGAGAAAPTATAPVFETFLPAAKAAAAPLVARVRSSLADDAAPAVTAPGTAPLSPPAAPAADYSLPLAGILVVLAAIAFVRA